MWFQCVIVVSWHHNNFTFVTMFSSLLTFLLNLYLHTMIVFQSKGIWCSILHGHRIYSEFLLELFTLFEAFNRRFTTNYVFFTFIYFY